MQLILSTVNPHGTIRHISVWPFVLLVLWNRARLLLTTDRGGFIPFSRIYRPHQPFAQPDENSGAMANIGYVQRPASLSLAGGGSFIYLCVVGRTPIIPSAQPAPR